ncbi:hypothetical protein BC827DRAFT_1219827, partial [Russula dissimulans]
MSLVPSCLLIWSLGRWMKHHAGIEQLNEIEAALQRKETARKRKHLSDKNVRAGTINCLL